MLNDIYQAVKAQLSTVETSENTQWFNMQYDGVMIYANGYFIEFPNKLDFDQLSKQARQTPITIRVHAYSQLVATQDGVPDQAVVDHEALAIAARDLLIRFVPEKEGAKLTTALQFRGWQHWHKWKGWMVTFVEFEAKMNF